MRFVFEIIDNFEDLMKELKVVMYNLSFKDNFSSFTVEDVELSNTPTSITNQLGPRDVPSHYIVLGIKECSTLSGGNNIIRPSTDDGTYVWNRDNVFLQTTSGTCTATILFLK